MHQPFEPHRRRPDRQRLRRRADAAEPAALGPAADAGGADRLRRRPGHDGRQRRRRRRRPAPRPTSTPPTARCSGRVFYNADGEMLIVPQQGRHRFVTELGVDRRRAAGDRRHPARRALPRRAARRQRPRLRLRELRRAFRLPDLGPIGSNGLANPRDFLTPVAAYEDVDGAARARREVHGPALVGADGPFAARRRRLARQLRAVQVRPAPLQHDRLDQLRPSRTRRSSWCCTAPRDTPGVEQHRLRDLPAAHRWRCRTPSARPGSTATSPASSWAWCTAPTTPRPRASRPAAPACTTA